MNESPSATTVDKFDCDWPGLALLGEVKVDICCVPGAGPLAAVAGVWSTITSPLASIKLGGMGPHSTYPQLPQKPDFE